MTMGPADMERKVRQLDNDVQSIYDILGSIQATQQRHGNRFDDIDHRLEGHDRRFDEIDRRLEGHDRRFDIVDKKLGALDQKVGTLDQTVGTIDQKLDTVIALLENPGR